jgi:hypothetical protein
MISSIDKNLADLNKQRRISNNVSVHSHHSDSQINNDADKIETLEVDCCLKNRLSFQISTRIKCQLKWEETILERAFIDKHSPTTSTSPPTQSVKVSH